MKSLSEDEVKSLMRTEAYLHNYNSEHEKTQRTVRQGFENLYPDDDRNIHPKNYYVWNTQGDDKVRGSHAQRQGQVFSWDNPPEGGHPGEDYGCRCTAEAYIPPKKNKNDRLQEINQRLVEIEEQLADLNEDRNHRILELDDIDNEAMAIAGALGLTGVNGLLNGVIDAVDIKGGRIDFDYDKISLPQIFKKSNNGILIGAHVGSELYEHKELIQRLDVLIKKREELSMKIMELNNKVTAWEEERQQLLQERKELGY